MRSDAISTECREQPMCGAISRIAVMTGISAALLAGCGNNVAIGPPPATSSKPPAVDVSTLDTGKYLTLPRKLGQVASEDEGRMAEAIRMAEDRWRPVDAGAPRRGRRRMAASRPAGRS